jgi:hypothetical protein
MAGACEKAAKPAVANTPASKSGLKTDFMWNSF